VALLLNQEHQETNAEIITVSNRVCVKAIRRNKRFIDDYTNYSGCEYQKLIAKLNDDKDLQVGLPCYECRRMIELGEECVSRRVNRTRKYYHILCGRHKNLI
jgi:hypothetical protein